MLVVQVKRKKGGDWSQTELSGQSQGERDGVDSKEKRKCFIEPLNSP